MTIPSQAELNTSILKKMQTGDGILNSGFTNYNMVWDAVPTSMPDGRTVDFLNGDGTPDTWVKYVSSPENFNIMARSIWVRPFFDNTHAISDCVVRTDTGWAARDGHYSYFYSSVDDFGIAGRSNNIGYSAVADGVTFSYADILHFLYLYHRTSGLDNGKSLKLFINGSLEADDDAGFGVGVMSTYGGVAAAWNEGGSSNANNLNGGVCDFVSLNWTYLHDTLGYSDEEIAQGLYINNYGPSQKIGFSWDWLVDYPIVPTVKPWYHYAQQQRGQ